tara:strand:+ start:942 stop:2093 length:1152 start_codon:yes stop_codon:yes gene_type:complete
MFNIKEYFLAFIDCLTFSALSKNEKSICVYSEGAAYFPYLRNVLEDILKRFNIPICYVSSNCNDPGLHYKHINLRTFFIGSGHCRNYFFSSLNSYFMIMTTPDLDKFQLKRSCNNLEYIYIQHSICSTHMIYREDAFDSFDAVCCIGKHQMHEIAARETLYKLKSKKLIPMRYFRLDEIMEYKVLEKTRTRNDKSLNFIVAPSWGKNGLIESGKAFILVKRLIELGHQVILRPHPQTKRNSQDKIKQILETYENNENFIFISNTQDVKSFYMADYMISDWSGVALEFAFALKKPIIFCDNEKKVNNPRYKKLKMEPIEVFTRSKLGCIWDCNSPIEEKIKKVQNFKLDEVYKLEKKFVFGQEIGSSILLNHIESILKERRIIP